MIRNLKRRTRNFIRGVKNIIRWSPILYKDRDWDHWFIYEILKTKLRHQAAYFQKEGITEGANEAAQKMLKCVEMIDIVQNERIIDDHLSTISCNDDSSTLWARLDEMEIKQQQAKKDLFSYLEKNIEHWWD